MSDFRTDSMSCEGCPLASISFADCRHTSNEDCKEVIIWLDEHDKQIRADAIDECIEALGNNIWDIAKLEQLKEQK